MEEKKCSFCRPQTYEFPPSLLLFSLHLSVPFLFISFLLCPTFIIRAHHLGWAHQIVTGCQRPQACAMTGCGGVQVSQPDTRGEIPCFMQGTRALPTPRVAFLLGLSGPRAAGYWVRSWSVGEAPDTVLYQSTSQAPRRLPRPGLKKEGWGAG